MTIINDIITIKIVITSDIIDYIKSLKNKEDEIMIMITQISIIMVIKIVIYHILVIIKRKIIEIKI
jgi:hypothetical protein|uniref:Uncharacterized protein n=1 Tax=CrAss-like virus sp. ctt4r3 TaxID=2823619 RepID=A0A8S5L7H4_9CAUD|nr:MAG TPA: hypothetical protein [CrAss-like virus sp. ctt4r3]